MTSFQHTLNTEARAVLYSTFSARKIWLASTRAVNWWLWQVPFTVYWLCRASFCSGRLAYAACDKFQQNIAKPTSSNVVQL